MASKTPPLIRRVIVRQLAERIGTDTPRFLCHYDLWCSCRQFPCLSFWESRVSRVMNYMERCIELRYCICSTNWNLSNRINNPIVKKFHLFFRMKPMLSVFHYCECSSDSICKFMYSI